MSDDSQTLIIVLQRGKGDGWAARVCEESEAHFFSNTHDLISWIEKDHAAVPNAVNPQLGRDPIEMGEMADTAVNRNFLGFKTVAGGKS